MWEPDKEEHRLWQASRSYMGGEITFKDLEKVESPHSQKLRSAVLAHARRQRKKKAMAREKTADERERHLWMASRLYMSGEITVDQLEEIELPHTLKLSKAILNLSKRKIRWNLLDSLRYLLTAQWLFKPNSSTR